MPSQKLTARTIENAKAPASGRLEIWDTLVRGFGLRVTERGVKSWTLMYRVNGRQRRLNLGRYPAYDLADARELARDALRQVGRGIDPADERKAALEAEGLGRSLSVRREHPVHVLLRRMKFEDR